MRVNKNSGRQPVTRQPPGTAKGNDDEGGQFSHFPLTQTQTNLAGKKVQTNIE
ncbi:hypothetical protein E2C01_049314 [Portunus trituberculatus]|uniref:Uncharacterized protein n=1 Tax=Portunus trituberculatus TaxID=210409 RepID=A0A5B7G595_PORTR|nr:hypothetical protein [Portunus trituberculatus]